MGLCPGAASAWCACDDQARGLGVLQRSGLGHWLAMSFDMLSKQEGPTTARSACKY